MLLRPHPGHHYVRRARLLQDLRVLRRVAGKLADMSDERVYAEQFFCVALPVNQVATDDLPIGQILQDAAHLGED